MARIRQAPPLNDTRWKGNVPIKRLLLEVEAEMDLSPLVNQCVAEAVSPLVSQYVAEVMERLGKTEAASRDSKEPYLIMRQAEALFQKELPQELEKALTSALRNAFKKAVKRVPEEPTRRGRKPGSTESPKRRDGKVRRRISEMKKAAGRLGRQKDANWSRAGLAREMGLLPQTFNAYGKKHPDFRESVEKVLREKSDNF